MKDNLRTCYHCGEKPVIRYLMQRPYKQAHTQHAFLCTGCYFAYSSRYERQGFHISAPVGITLPSRINGGPITEDVVMQQPKPAAQ